MANYGSNKILALALIIGSFEEGPDATCYPALASSGMDMPFAPWGKLCRENRMGENCLDHQARSADGWIQPCAYPSRIFLRRDSLLILADSLAGASVSVFDCESNPNYCLRYCDDYPHIFRCAGHNDARWPSRKLALKQIPTPT